MVLLGLGGMLVSVTKPLEIGGIDDNIMVLCPIDAVLVIDIDTVVRPPPPTPPPAPSPVVVVTTATLHSSCMALPSLNNPTMLVSSTSASAHAVLTSAFI
jgi:hypothetical protein